MKTQKNIFIAFILNLIFSLVEFIGGILTGSIAIISDAIHDFGDATSIGVSYLFERKSKYQPNDTYTYGYARYSVLGGLITISILLIGSIIVIYNATNRLINPVLINYNGMLILASVGLSINLFATYFTHGGHSINQKAVNLHMLEDVFGWLIILIGAVVMRFTNFYILDPILSIIVSLLVLFNSFKSLKEILDIFLLKIPNHINVKQLKNHIKDINGVVDAHHIHVWTTDGETIYASLHVVVNEYDSNIKSLVKSKLNEYRISHVTIEMETVNENCLEKQCVLTPHSNCCKHHHH